MDDHRDGGSSSSSAPVGGASAGAKQAEDEARARAAADAKRAAQVSRSKQIAEKFEQLVKYKLTQFFRVELASVGLALFSLIVSGICTSYSPALVDFNAVPIAANVAICVVASFGAGLLYLKNSLDKTQYIITSWFTVYVLVFLLALAAQALLVLAAITASITCTAQSIAANGPPLCLNSALLGLVSFNCFLFFTLLSLRAITLYSGYQLYFLLTKTKNAVVRATAKVDMRRSLSTRRRASFHSVDGSERIVDPVPRKPVPAAFVGGESKVSLAHQPDPSLAV
eukprot:Unigene259_Nuclearia_a/m.917 Unigene259_Nuclearia_a/g.917  ORF Unigene259_Nuclearia_a/g.917 Unigene259_Nuclearia_a/m.917 type:complete len:283 (+) Unigene259_Nuclearia_a:1145-1993(+)